MQDLTIIYLQKKVSMLEDQLNLIQGMIKHDSTRWEIKHGTNFEKLWLSPAFHFHVVEGDFH
jgi:hypothetical protein